MNFEAIQGCRATRIADFIVLIIQREIALEMKTIWMKPTGELVLKVCQFFLRQI